MTRTVNELLLAAGVEQVAAARPGSGDLLEAFGEFVRAADDEALVRINPVRFAQQYGFSTAAVVELFLYARKVGLLTMEWQYVCPGCGEIVERLTSLTSATSHFFCQVCSVDRDADLSDYIEVTFTVPPEIRRSRYHDPWSLSPEEHFFSYRFTQTGVVDDGRPIREHLRRCAVVCAYVEPGATETFTATAEPGYLWFTNGPALVVGDERTSECRSFSFEYTGTHSGGFRADIAAGPVEIEFTNATDERYALMIISFSTDFHITMQPFLSGAALLSNQTFLDLFVTETLVAGEGLAVKRLALLFTDLQGSTALYERIGDMKAFDLVRLHFGHLRECIARNSGALVKTIGDAVMASFVDPLDALRAALDMRAQIAELNARRRQRSDQPEDRAARGCMPRSDAERPPRLLRPDGEHRRAGARPGRSRRDRRHGLRAFGARRRGARRRIRARVERGAVEGHRGRGRRAPRSRIRGRRNARPYRHTRALSLVPEFPLYIAAPSPQDVNLRR